MKHFIAMVVVFLSACAGMSPSKFTPVNSPSWFVLDREFTWIALKANAFRPDVVNGLAPGRYQAVFEDAEHIYYQGPEKCVLPFTDNGGIRLPKSGVGGQPLLWVYIRDDSAALASHSAGGPLVAGMSKLEAGRIRPFTGAHVDEQLLANISVRR